MIHLLHEGKTLINYSPSKWDWSSSRREHYNLWICLEGEGEMLFKDQKIEIYSGVGILLPPEGFVQGVKKGSGVLRNIGMHFLPLSEQHELTWIAHSGKVVQLQHLPLIRELAAFLEASLFQAQDKDRNEENLIGCTLLSVFLRDLKVGPEGSIDRLIRKQAEEMRARPERTRSGPELAGEVGLSSSQFVRRFYKLFDMSPRDFLLQQRIEKAQSFLMESQMTVGEIAEALGYRDVGYFSRQFKQKTDCSPLAFRKRFLNNPLVVNT
jgi:AraC-like DNA-binding protein